MRTLALGVLLATAAAALPVEGQIYRWVDDRGVVNFTNIRPPVGVRVTPLDTDDLHVSTAPTSPHLDRLRLPPAANAPPGDVDRATVEALGRALAARSPCSVNRALPCANATAATDGHKP